MASFAKNSLVINCETEEDYNCLTGHEETDAEVIIIAGRVVKNRYGLVTPPS